MLLMAKHLPGTGAPGIVLTAPVFADSEEQARADLAFLNDCPVMDKALMSNPYFPITLSDGYSGVMTAYPNDTRWGTDNMWTHGPIDTLVPALGEILDTMPPEPSHCLWMNWSPPAQRPDMAFSIEDDIYIATYGGWQSPAHDEDYGSWATDHMKRLEPVATGIQLADENLGQRPARFLSETHMQRFDRIRDHYDPDHRFAGWLSRPPADWGRA
jgi:FAD/FMN-containing dehydrogenase